MTGSDHDEGEVLLVDDEPDVLELYERYLSDYPVATAETGEAALETVDPAVDVVVLDRRLPDVHGDDVLERIRARQVDCRVAMVTAVEPDFDVIEMPFDDYLVKPVRRQQLRETVEHLFARLEYSERLTEFYRVASKIAALRAAKPAWELEDSEEFTQLRRRGERLRHQVTETLVELDDYLSAFADLEPVDPTDGGPDPDR